MRSVGSLEELMAIRDMYGTLSLAVCKADQEAWLQCWADDARWVTDHFDAVGKSAIAQQWAAIWENFSKVAVLHELGAYTVSGAVASGDVCVYETISLKAGGTLSLAGFYNDELVRMNGLWRLKSRKYNLLTQSAG
jgi:ketosteroid isomerase-like protein